MKEDSKLNEIKQVVDLISVVPLDFKDDNGNLICGYKFHYYTDVADSEKDKIYGKKYSSVFLSKDSLDDKLLYKNKIYPCRATIYFELVDLNKKPKAIKVVV